MFQLLIGNVAQSYVQKVLVAVFQQSLLEEVAERGHDDSMTSNADDGVAFDDAKRHIGEDAVDEEVLDFGNNASRIWRRHLEEESL